MAHPGITKSFLQLSPEAATLPGPRVETRPPPPVQRTLPEVTSQAENCMTPYASIEYNRLSNFTLSHSLSHPHRHQTYSQPHFHIHIFTHPHPHILPPFQAYLASLPPPEETKSRTKQSDEVIHRSNDWGKNNSLKVPIRTPIFLIPPSTFLLLIFPPSLHLRYHTGR